MQTQKDHVHAYQFMMERMTTALVTGDPSNSEMPAKRGRSGMLIGAGLALLAVIGFGVYGLIVPGGNTAYKQKGAILVEKESGTRYVYLDGRLMTTPNLASAMLIQGGQSKVTLISRQSLAGLPHGPRIGIEGAPDTVPTRADMVSGTLVLCPTTVEGRSVPGMSVNLDDRAPVSAVPQDRYVPVLSAGNKIYLLWRGFKHLVPDTSALVVLGLASATPQVMSDTMLALVPDGPALSAAKIPEAGKAGQTVGGRPTKIGDVFVHRPGNSTEQRYVLLERGLSPLSATEFGLLSAKADKPPAEIDAASILTAPFAPDNSYLSRLPDLVGMQQVDLKAGTPCLRQTGSGTEITTTPVLATGGDRWPAVARVGAIVPPNRGVLVTELSIPGGQRIPNRYLITDRGKRYAVPDNESIQALGLEGVQPIPMRTEVLSTIPSGPVLSRTGVVVEQGG